MQIKFYLTLITEKLTINGPITYKAQPSQILVFVFSSSVSPTATPGSSGDQGCYEMTSYYCTSISKSI